MLVRFFSPPAPDRAAPCCASMPRRRYSSARERIGFSPHDALLALKEKAINPSKHQTDVYRHCARLVCACRPGDLARSPLRSHPAAEQEDVGISICGLARPEEAALCCGAYRVGRG